MRRTVLVLILRGVATVPLTVLANLCARRHQCSTPQQCWRARVLRWVAGFRDRYILDVEALRGRWGVTDDRMRGAWGEKPFERARMVARWRAPR